MNSLMRNTITAMLVVVACAANIKCSGENKNLSDSIFQSESILALMHQVNTYTSTHPYRHRNTGEIVYDDRNWIRATWYTGVMALYYASQEQEILDQALAWGRKHQWQRGHQPSAPGNNLTCGQTYLELYFLKNDPAMYTPMQQWIDSGERGSPTGSGLWYVHDGKTLRYSDVLYVAPPTLAMLAKATGEQRYLDFMHSMYWDVVDDIYDMEYRMFYRDRRYKDKVTVNGKKSFWSRGNGWVLGGLPRILTYLPADDPYRTRYIELFREMAESIAAVQPADGLWRSNLADANEYPQPETSGSAFFCYALTWGINNGHLDRTEYLPVVQRAWQGLVGAVQPNGMLGWVQTVNAEPGPVQQKDTHEYAVGAFLLAGSEMMKLHEER
jgi:unsaturated rhamnogalacturonyl hydrolase